MSDETTTTRYMEAHDASPESAIEFIEMMCEELDNAPEYERWSVSVGLKRESSELTKEIAESMSFQELRQEVNIDGSNPTKDELIAAVGDSND